MKRFIAYILIRLSLKPYKSITLQTGSIVKHYRNGNIIVDTQD